MTVIGAKLGVFGSAKGHPAGVSRLPVEGERSVSLLAGTAFRFSDKDGRVSGPHPERGGYVSFASFRDPDGNGRLLQEVTTRLPGRVTGNTTYASTSDLSQALRGSRQHTGNTRSASDKPTRTGPIGTPSIWCASKTGEKLPQ